MVIIGNYSRKLRFSDAKSSKRATPHSFLLLLFLKLKFPPLPPFQSEILPKIAPLGRKLSDFVSISAVFLPFFCYYFFFVSFFTDFISFSPFCLLLFPIPLSAVFTAIKYLILHLCTNSSCIAAICTLYYHVFILPNSIRLSICAPFFLNLMLNYTKIRFLIYFCLKIVIFSRF